MDYNQTSKQDTRDNRNFRRRTDTEKINAFMLAPEAELRIAIEATGLGIFDYYPLSEELHWSDTAKAHFGLSPDAHVNYNVFLVGLHPEDRERVDRLMHNALQRENGGMYSTEYRTIGIEDGKERWIAARGQAFFNAAGEAVRFIGTTMDITDHKRMEESVRESEEHYRLLFNKSPVPKWVIDLDTFAFIEVNDAAVEYYGYRRDEFERVTAADIQTAEEYKKFENWVAESISEGKTIEGRNRTKHRKKNNEIIDVDVRYAEIEYNRKRALLAVITDFSLQKKTER